MNKLQQMGAKFHKNTGVRYLPNEESPLLAITGEIPRKTVLKKASHINTLTTQSNRINLIPDPLIKDDQAIVVWIHYKGKLILQDVIMVCSTHNKSKTK
jgi:hypothetical protein